MTDRTCLLLKCLVDLTVWTALTPLAFLIRLETFPGRFFEAMVALTLVGLPVKAAILYGLGLFRRSWRKSGVSDLMALGEGIALATLALAAFSYYLPPALSPPRSIPLIEAMLALLALGGVRLLTRVLSERARARGARRRGRGRARRVLIVGAGEAGTLVARELQRHPESLRTPVGFLDDDRGKRRRRFVGVPVVGTIDELGEAAVRHRVDEVLIAVPSAAGDVVRRVVEHARAAGVEYRIMPGIYELLSGRVSLSEVREVDVEDLLRREPVRREAAQRTDYLAGRVVLVTGAGGSIGSEIVRQVARCAPAGIVLLGHAENAIYDIEWECRTFTPGVTVHAVIADVRDRAKLRQVFERYRPHVVFHAAAHKHVPLMEAHPDEAVLNNVGGTQNLVDLALAFGTERFVNISTDKAVNPTSVMGASKRVAEFVVERAAREAAPGQRFVSVRFGNVLGSRGSVIPLFKRQIALRAPITVTHPDMKRYFMTIPEASQLVLQAGGLEDGGSVYVLDMGSPVRIVDLARDLILLSGLEPDVDVPIVFTGIRPGEKLFEELLTAEEGTEASCHEQIFVARHTGLDAARLAWELDELYAAARARDEARIRAAFRRLIPSNLFAAPEPARPVAVIKPLAS